MKRKKRSGTRLAFPLLALLVAILPPAASAAKKKLAPAAYGLVSGTVFQESGYALPDADVVLIPDPQPDSAPVKVKKLQAISDARGEFVFRVPPAPMRYTVTVTAKGFQVQQKSVTVQGEERVDVTFQLQAESKH
ncbi:MAG: carboxypeptidase-like regulatory domain-containing protein [Acidobacteriia bacterium]|nr:carboxypeptidase-like regulatory domain-containing protein [Terriglobia bacterium]